MRRVAKILGVDCNMLSDCPGLEGFALLAQQVDQGKASGIIRECDEVVTATFSWGF